MKFARRLNALAAALVMAAGGALLAGAAPTSAAEPDPGSLFRNTGNGLCMSTADDPANAFQGTATFAPCDLGDPRQRWRLELANQPAWQVVSVSTGKCVADVAGWGLAWLGACDANDVNQFWHFNGNDAGDLFWVSHDDGKLLSTPYRQGTSYVTVRNDLDPKDARYKWRLLR
ncbi:MULTISPECIES: ricin-type beta-trefoil lectin domain protein [unclassified Streptomyces]|uniref:ricin-type beta-trefoil lectin domain protein n=1 Tax=unclassified Streptomyces TaxID=2593676 RepID=UPI00365B46D6